MKTEMVRWCLQHLEIYDDNDRRKREEAYAELAEIEKKLKEAK